MRRLPDAAVAGLIVCALLAGAIVGELFRAWLFRYYP